jgi:oxygen-independent coproporphyrinogen-3 oxidase
MELPPNSTIAREMRADGGTGGAAIPTWNDKRARLGRAFAALEAGGYRVSSAYTLVRADREVHFKYRDNLWHGADLLPVGVSSFGHAGGVHLQNEKEIEPWLSRVRAGELPIARGYGLSPDERLVRELILQLKLGVVRPRYFRDKFGVDLRRRFETPLTALVDAGLATVGDDEIRLGRDALLRVDGLLPAFYLPPHHAR